MVIRANGAVNRRMVEAVSQLKVICRHGIGVDAIDLVAAAERGVVVVNTPEANNVSVGEAFFALALGLVKRVKPVDAAVRSGIGPSGVATAPRP